MFVFEGSADIVHWQNTIFQALNKRVIDNGLPAASTLNAMKVSLALM